MTPSIERLSQTRDDLSFVLTVLSRQERWDNEELDKRKRALDTLKLQLQQIDERIERIELQQRASAKLHRRLNGILYAVAILSVLYLLFQAELTVVPTIAVCTVFVVAIFKASPDAQWKRILLLSLIPLAVVLLLFSIAPVRSYLDNYNTDMAVLGLLYAITFSLIGTNGKTG